MTPDSISQLDHVLSEPDDGVLDALKATTGRFIVLGAGGKMGFHVSQMLQRSLRLLERSDQVVAVSRFSDPATRKRFIEAGCDVRSIDLTDSTQVAELPDGDNVIYLAGIKFGTRDRPDLLQTFNVEMPQTVVERYRDSCIVALSSGCVYPFVEPQCGGSTEDIPTEPPGDYARSCVGREAAFVAAASRWGTRSSLIRLNYSIDLRYGVLVDIAEKVLASQPVDVTMGYANVIWQRDAVSHIIQSLPHATAPPFVLNVTGPEVLRIREIAEAFGRRFNRPAIFTGHEADTAWLSNAAKSHRMFGAPQASVENMIGWTAAWLQRGGETLGKPTQFETRDGDY